MSFGRGVGPLALTALQRVHRTREKPIRATRGRSPRLGWVLGDVLDSHVSDAHDRFGSPTMDIRRGIEGLASLEPDGVVCIGNFDGVHRGHQRILSVVRELQAKHPGSSSIVVTFEPHPLTVLRPELAPPRLTTAVMKRRLIEQAGIDHLIELEPHPDVLNLRAEEFWAILRDQVRPRHLVEGQTFTFGKDRAGTIDTLREWSRHSNIGLHVVGPVEVTLLDLRLVPVSSSLIRWLLVHGRARDAAICLGRPYLIEGEVVRGFARGRSIGVPTANLRCEHQLICAEGVYAGRCTIDGTTYPAAVSIGTLPTFQERAFQVEAHMLDFDGDLYGRHLLVEITDWLRSQMRFKNIEALKRQIMMDLHETRSRFDLLPQRPIAV